MVEVLEEYFAYVHATDVASYGRDYETGSFVGEGLDVAAFPHGRPNWIITNPPFVLAERFVRRALVTALQGVAILARTAFIESETRYAIFSLPAFRLFAPFAGRLAMVKGRWDPAASSATSYAWFVWLTATTGRVKPAELVIIPPEAKRVCTRADDIRRFAERRQNRPSESVAKGQNHMPQNQSLSWCGREDAAFQP